MPSAALVRPVRSRAVTTGVLPQQHARLAAMTKSTSSVLSFVCDDVLGDEDHLLLGNRPRRRTPRGAMSVISVGTLVGQSTLLTVPSSSWPCAGIVSTSAGEMTTDVQCNLALLEPDLARISRVSDCPEYHSGIMRANRRLESLVDDDDRRRFRHRHRFRRELKYLWQRMSLMRQTPRRPQPQSSSSPTLSSSLPSTATTGVTRRGSIGRHPIFGRNGESSKKVKLLRSSTGYLT